MDHIKFDDICKSIGYNPRVWDAPAKKLTFFGYANGACIGIFTERQEAVNAMAKVIEENVDTTEYDEYVASRREKEALAQKTWLGLLKADFVGSFDKTLTPAGIESLFELLYDKAWDRGHSSGYDCVRDHLSELMFLSSEVIGIGLSSNLNSNLK